MTISLYNYNGMSNVVHKQLGTPTYTGECQFVGPYQEYETEIKLKAANVDGNYAVVDGKYYFVDDRIIYRNGYYIIPLRLDVLMTYQTLIDAMEGYVVRGGVRAAYIQDDKDTVTCRCTLDKIPFTSTIDDTEAGGTYVLVTSQNFYATVGG